MNRSRQFIPIIVVSLVALLLVIYKWSQLALPSFWDEGFPYAYAIRYLTDHHLTILPSGMPPLYSTGHPTLFYFLSATWMKLFGIEMWHARLFPLLISVLVLFALYRFGKTFFNSTTGMLAVILFATRAVFVAQSSQLLPETLVTLFTILALHSWLRNKKWIYFLWASLLVLTKESGLVLPAALCLWELVSIFRYRKLSIVAQIKNRFHTPLPFVVSALFFLIQRAEMGWYLFPRHVGAINLDKDIVYSKLVPSMATHFFVYYGGIATSILVVLATLIFFFRKMKWVGVQRRTIFVSLTFMLCFVAFSCINYYSPRYILCLYPLWYTIAAFLVLETMKGISQWVPISLIVFIALFQSYYTHYFRTIGDYDMGYMDCVTTQRDAIRWCVENGYRDKNIFAQQQLERAMESDAAGFIHQGEEFKHVNKGFDSQTALFIFTCTESDPSEDEARKLNLKKLVRFEQGRAWTEIYAPADLPAKN